MATRQALPLPSTSHLSFSTIYEPAEDTFLVLETFETHHEQVWLRKRFPPATTTSTLGDKFAVARGPAPLVLEVGPGSGTISAFLTVNARAIFGQQILTLGVDVNIDACLGTRETVERNYDASGKANEMGFYLASINGDLTTAVKDGDVDILVFNPPYVPTEDLPAIPQPSGPATNQSIPLAATETDQPVPVHIAQRARAAAAQAKHERESQLLALSYAGGHDGMEITNKLLAQLPEVLSRRGVAYVLLCARNKPLEVRDKVRAWQAGHDWTWQADIVNESGGKGGWERLSILRIWRDCENEIDIEAEGG
ncbi:eRF1 methyltransferase catalytic subunit MTQ2 [Cyphellophora attinorum]|uniref:ERF1 methyltransferase catalytic subunit MTQ2 n=1 Tax=Cyphellophora attinorum TaxID=1664694 RepID=A0A0N1HK33_9EURO|nr:eRF1 methyltransferase catalytic subunit MTQ2 [Phialophora attinorum]KPI34474.1 eRF1 methyltransferase catalytic subunit MTQ2 [Phialophora attinorum]